ncbi:MAG TPA: prepilin-type N-terminal cleavage/methylation domain-containing protein [Pirellulales bacterium]|nr:prepilin-type N-terminal cleavage/methylation domain-containing protein [Pirellulales bacterium]
MTTNRRAFTLLELLLVLALLAIMASFSWPALRGSMGGQNLRGAADQVRTRWLRARTKAINSGETISFRYQPDTGRFRIETRTQQQLLLAAFSGSSGGAAPPTDARQTAASTPADPPVEDELPESVSFAGGEVTVDSRATRLAAEDRVRSPAGGSWSEAVLFYPDGTATAARVVLVGERGRAIAVEVRSLTGNVRVGPIFSIEEAR